MAYLKLKYTKFDQGWAPTYTMGELTALHPTWISVAYF